MKLNHIIESFQLTEEERNNLIKHADIEEEFIPDSFKRVAQAILSGHFEVGNGTNIIKKVYPTMVEIYYHEEDVKEENLKDYIVYHRNHPNYKNYKKDNILINMPKRFPIGALNAHQSGIDITFEHIGIANNIVRASALIRGFRIEEFKENGEIGEKVKEDTRSTYLYDALFTGLSMINSEYSLRWVDDEEKNIEHINVDKRVNAKWFKFPNKHWKEQAEQGKACDFIDKKKSETDPRLRRFFVKQEKS